MLIRQLSRSFVVFLLMPVAVHAQISAFEGDGVLNAPYRGTVDSLREASMDIAYGEVVSQVEPRVDAVLTSSTVQIWADGGDWDRSVLRFYEGLDASGDEIRLDQGVQTVYPDVDGMKRLSFKAIGIKTLGERRFTIHMQYETDGFLTTPDLTVRVAPITGSFGMVAGEDQAFLPGVPVLDVAVGNARLSVPIGRTAEMIGAAFAEKDYQLGPSGIKRNDVVFPGAAESVHIQNRDQFRLFSGSPNANKEDWGTPWPGHLTGYWINQGEIFGPHGTIYDSADPQGNSTRRIHYIRPWLQFDYSPCTVKLEYTGDYVTEIHDQVTPQNSIWLTRTANAVTGIATSDGRQWSIESDPVTGWVTGVVPEDETGERHFAYTPTPSDPLAAPRVQLVSDGNSNLMYAFWLFLNGQNAVADVLAEMHYFDQNGRVVVQHEPEQNGVRVRKEFMGPDVYRQFDFEYDPSYPHRLASNKAYTGLNGTGTSHTTTYTHSVDSSDGTVALTRVDLPDGTWILHDYDSNVRGTTVDFGFRTKSTQFGQNDGSVVIYDVDYEFFYDDYQNREWMFFKPRLARQRDGRGVSSEIVYDYDDGGVFVDPWKYWEGHDLNRLLSITGPTTTSGSGSPRTPQTTFIYGDSNFEFWLMRTEVLRDGTSAFVETYEYDDLVRRTAVHVDPEGEDLVTHLLYCDAEETQDRIVVDPDGYWSRTQYDANGRLVRTERFLNANAGNLQAPCADPAGPVYQTVRSYDDSGWLTAVAVDNKDQDGNTLAGEDPVITTTYARDRLGRLITRTVDPGGVNQEAHYNYDWQSDLESVVDTSGRGRRWLWEDGRGLPTQEMPLDESGQSVYELATVYGYDAVGRVTSVEPPTYPEGRRTEYVYDDFGRLVEHRQTPGSDGGQLVTSAHEYDAASNVTRTTVTEAGRGVLADTTHQYDEGGFRFETRRRGVAGQDDPDDPLSQLEYDWAGNVVVERDLGDGTVPDREFTTVYDAAGRVGAVYDSTGGQTTYERDGRGNVETVTVKIDALNEAVTDIAYDALSRPIHVIEPEDGAGGRAQHVSRYDSRGQLRRESVLDASDAPVTTAVFDYDLASRPTRSALLHDASSTISANSADVTADRVVDLQYDADGRPLRRTAYNNNSGSPLETETAYDAVGRVAKVTDPAGDWTETSFADNGRVASLRRFDGLGVRTLQLGYDGHDRVRQETALGGGGATPDLVTLYEFDGLGRRCRVTNPRGITARTDYDLLGRQTAVTENEGGGSQERLTEFTYNRLDQLVARTAHNKQNDGTALASQVTEYRYDELGRVLRMTLPDGGDVNDPNCTDCVKLVYDDAGRLTQRTDQRGWITTFARDDRGQLRTRTTGSTLDTFERDAVGRLTLALRGTTADPDAVSALTLDYSDLGDPTREQQAIGSLPALDVAGGFDQAGNRLSLDYPTAGIALGFAPTALNQTQSIQLFGQPLVDYSYQGAQLVQRRAGLGGQGYSVDFGYDQHRRVTNVENRFDTGSTTEDIAVYRYEHDENGNPTRQVAHGLPAFARDNRSYLVDDLDRLASVSFENLYTIAAAIFDLLGNREWAQDRGGSWIPYGPVNAANEYASIGGQAVTYDAVGNLQVDEDGRQYHYDEQNRLSLVVDDSDPPEILVRYTYDALGRRIMAEFAPNDPQQSRTVTYVYDGPRVIEERDDAGATTRFHIGGGQYIDERVASFSLRSDEGGRSGWDFYLAGANNSVVGRGDAAGTSFERFNYTDVGSWSGYDLQPALLRHDADEDGDIDGADWVSFQNCFATTDAACLLAHDFDVAGASDGAIDLDDWAGFEECLSGPDVVPGFACSTGRLARTPPASDQFGLHGRPVDVLPDGKVLMYVRARFYDPEHARWLQRDPTGYADGNNLYEAFGANATRFTDPMGLEVMEFGGPLEDSCGLLGYGSGLASRAAGWSNNDLIDTLGAALQVAHLANTAGNQAAALDAEARVKVLKAELQARAAELKGTARSGFRERQLAVNPNAARDPLMAIYEYRDQEMEAQLLSTAEALIATINEPADWALTARDMYNNGFSPWQLASFLPLVSGGSVKAAAKVAEVGQAARAANNANDLARVLDLGGYSGKQAERISDAARGVGKVTKGGTYKLVDPRTGKVMRTGRTGDLARRQAEHARHADTKHLRFEVDKYTDSYAAQRGREQIIHDLYDPPMNKIRPIRPNHPERQDYLDAAGELGP